MEIIGCPDGVREQSRRWRAAGETVAFVPTLGSLHEGHVSLVDSARQAGADRVIVSIFLNPTQFGPGEDLSAYPRDDTQDERLLRGRGVDLLFRPTVETIYPSGRETVVSLTALPRHLCGRSRPGHFDGVATVVTLLFNIVEPHLAVFGEKDFQQLQVIRRLTRDLHLPIEIVGAPIVRAQDGLALSSRNAYLDSAERKRATCLFEALTKARSMVAAGERSSQTLISHMRQICEESGGTVDYVDIVDLKTLKSVAHVDGPCRAVLAVGIGPARLLDNTSLP